MAKVTSGLSIYDESVYSARLRENHVKMYEKRFTRYDNVYARVRLSCRFLEFLSRSFSRPQQSEFAYSAL